jgi:hypothetical protein
MSLQDKNNLLRWEKFRESMIKESPAPLNETSKEKKDRIARLEADPESWKAYYFKKFYTSEPADFQKRATRRIEKHYKQWYEVRAWSRELAKSTLTMMDTMRLMLMGRMRNMLLISHSFDNACELLMPYMIALESNPRILNDYGIQKGFRSWEIGKFITRAGASFRAIGSGQSPRGTRNEEARPDIIVIDDIDTDEKGRNQKRIEDTWKWIERALIPAMSVAGNKLIIFCGNIISRESVIVKASRVADYFEVINIRDKNGRSTWPQKNSEADIDYILSKISYTSAQQEYFNNPITEGTVFKEMSYKKMAPLEAYRFLVAYGDPSFKSTRKNDYKAVILIGKIFNEYHVIKAYVEQTTTARMAEWYNELHDYVKGRVPLYMFIEANATQDLIFDQVKRFIVDHGWQFMVTGDYRTKGDKFSRIETALEPINSNGQLFLNAAEKDNPHMKRLEEQFLALEPSLSSHDDGPDAVEGGKWILDKKIVSAAGIQLGKRGYNKNKKRY